jgi:hypothetical protein
MNITDYDDTHTDNPIITKNDKNNPNTNDTNHILITDDKINQSDTCIILGEPENINNADDTAITFQFEDEQLINDLQSQYGMLLKNFLDKYNAKMELSVITWLLPPMTLMIQ